MGNAGPEFTVTLLTFKAVSCTIPGTQGKLHYPHYAREKSIVQRL